MEGAVSSYKVLEDVKVGAVRKDLKFTVLFNEEAHCIRGLFESKGILCRHAVALITERKVDHIPTRFVVGGGRM